MPPERTNTLAEEVALAGDQTPLADLVVVHQCTVLGPPGKGWRTTVRIQDGWQGATISHWSRGGSDIPCGVQKAVDDARSALEEALTYLSAF